MVRSKHSSLDSSTDADKFAAAMQMATAAGRTARDWLSNTITQAADDHAMPLPACAYPGAVRKVSTTRVKQGRD